MGWEYHNRCRFYTRSHWVNGRVVREYVGVGAVGEAAAAADAQRRAERQAQLAARRAEQARWEAADHLAGLLDEGSTLWADACLLLAGYHRHAHHTWTRPRVYKNPARP